MKIVFCRSCNSKKFSNIIDLGKQPWCNNFLNKKDLKKKEKKYPLKLIQCEKCELLQLDYTVPKEIMFLNHDYLSSTTVTLKKFFFKLAKENKKQFKIGSKEIILDIGGNDGTQMLQYKKIGLKNCINIESASNIANISKNNQIKTYNNFFNYKFVRNNIKKKSVKLINASGVFFHLEELHSVLDGINYCLKDDGILIVQFMYAGSMIDNNNFDTIYHEHLCLYTIKSLANLLETHNLEIFDCKFDSIHSGSVIAKICKTNYSFFKKTKRYYKAIKKDKEYSKNSFKKFGRRIKIHINKLKKEIKRLISKGNKIYCFGAPAKGSTLLNTLKLNTKFVQKCVEINKLKIGKYLPGSRIPIVCESKIDKPDIYFLLSHNFVKEILKKNKNQKFLIPFPEIKIIQC